MSWFEKFESGAGMVMSITDVPIIEYERLKKLFGKPHELKSFNDGTPFEAIWYFSILGLKCQIEISSSDWFRNYAMEKGLESGKVPSLTDKRVKGFKIIGDREIVGSIIKPLLLQFLMKEYSSKTSKNAIKYVLEDME